MRRIVGLAVAGLLVAACSSSSGGSPTPSPSASTAAVASPAPSPTPIPGCLPGCVTPDLTRPGDLDPGDYTTQNWFGREFTISVPAGWTSFEDSTGEFGLQPVGHPDDQKLVFWLDIYPVRDDGKATPVDGFDGTAKSLVAWTEANPNVKVLKKSTDKIGSVEATTLELGRSPNARNVDPGCPPEIQPCVGLYGFPQWNEDFYGVAGPFHIRLYAAEAVWGGQPHAIYAVVDAATDELYTDLAPVAIPMIEGARLPLGVASASE